MCDFSYIQNNLCAVSEQIHALAEHLGTEPPRLVCVSKSASDEELLALLSYGALDIAENRPQELIRRAQLLSAHGYAPTYHQIGRLQSNKAAKVLTVAPLIHSLDSPSTLAELERVGARRGTAARVLIEVNSAEEVAKSGVLPKDVFSFYEQTLTCPHVQVLGLMTMGPVCEDARLLRPYFRLTRTLLDELAERYGFAEKPILSMGMSDSFSVAIEEGSTLVRVGRRLFCRDI